MPSIGIWSGFWANAPNLGISPKFTSFKSHRSSVANLTSPKTTNWLVVSTYPSEKWWTSSVGMMIPFPTVSGKSIQIPWFQTSPTRFFLVPLIFHNYSWWYLILDDINPALQPNSIPESSTYVFFQTLCQSPVFSVPRNFFRTSSQIQDLAILGYQW